MGFERNPSFSSMPPAPGPTVGLFPSSFQGKNRNTLWYAWLGFGISFSMLVFDLSPYLALLTGLVLVALWVHQNVESGRLVWEVLYFAVDCFFREVGCRGEHKVPATGPVVFACGPHSNQFLDGIVISSVSKRSDIGYVIAEVTLRRKFVGLMCKALSPIGIERPQDVALRRPGTVQVRRKEVKGEDTDFSSADVDSVLMIDDIGQGRIKEVKSSTSVILNNCLVEGDEWSAEAKFKVAPNVVGTSFYESAYTRLRDGHVVAIFPEGGSHDQPKMLDLKPGVAIIALGGSAKLGWSIPIVPVGLTYFQGHRFRSRAFVDFGDPIYVSPDQIENFLSGPEGKREEVADLMTRIEDALRSVTVQTDSYKDLQLFWALRRLYTPRKKRLSSHGKQSLNRQFIEGYKKVKHHQRVKDLVIAVNLYTTKLKQYGLHDHMVAHRLGSLANIKESAQLYSLLIRTFAFRLLFLVLSCLCWIPSGIIALPFIVSVRLYSSRKAREAVKKSKVKIAGRDVMATWKLLVSLVLIPVMHAFYTLIVLNFADHRWATVYFFVMPVISVMNFKTAENVVRLARSLRPLYIFIRGKTEAKNLVDMRTWCVREVAACVDELGWLDPIDADELSMEN